MSSQRLPSRPDQSLSPLSGRPATHVSQNLRAMRARKIDTGGGDDGFSLNLLWQSLIRWWAIALPMGILLAAAGVGLILHTFEPTYQAAALIRIEDETPYIVQPLKPGDGSERFIRTQFELLRSPLVLGPVVADPEVARLAEIVELADPAAVLAGRVDIASIGDSELYEVSCTGESPEAAAVLTNAIMQEYFNLRDEDETNRVRKVIDLLEQEKRRRAEDVAARRDEVRRLGQRVLGHEAEVGREGFAVLAVAAETNRGPEVVGVEGEGAVQ